MQIFNFSITSYRHRFIHILLILVLIHVTTQVSSQEKSAKKSKPKPFEVDVSLGVIYDDNILKYSQKYLDRFLNNQDEGRFHIETYDDVILNPTLGVASTFNIFKKQKSKVSINYSYSSYIVNNVKNWNSFSVGFLQNFAKKASFRIAYNYIPEFYVRHFRDEDLVEVYGYVPETFVPFAFSKDNYSFWIQNTFFKNTRARLVFAYAQYFHNEHYTEYDCDNLTYGIQLNQPITKKVKIDAGFEFTTSDAKGYDEPGETKETSDDADADNKEEAFFFGVNWQIPDIKKLKHSLSAKIGYERKYYTTENYVELDPEHAGRLDQVMSYSFNYDIKLNKYFTLSAFYRFMGRNSSTTSPINSNYVSNEKDYKQNQVGIELNYNLKF